MIGAFVFPFGIYLQRRLGLSAFERAGVAYLAGSRKNLKIVVDGKEYFVHVKDSYRALGNPNFHAHILQLVKPSQEDPAKPKPLEFSFSVVLKESDPSQTERRITEWRVLLKILKKSVENKES